MAAAQAAVAAGTARANILLEMLGERDEEVDNLQAEISEVKETYRIQLEALMARQLGSMAPGAPSSSGGTDAVPA